MVDFVQKLELRHMMQQREHHVGTCSSAGWNKVPRTPLE